MAATATATATAAAAATAIPSIACIGIIGKHDNPLHISLFPPHENAEVDMLFVLNSSLDIFDMRARAKTLDQDLGLLQPMDERLATYGWLTNTGIKFIIVVDMLGRRVADDEVLVSGGGSGGGSGVGGSGSNGKPVYGLRDTALKPAFRAVHTAYIQLLQNPFHTPQDRKPLQLANGYSNGDANARANANSHSNGNGHGNGNGAEIKSKRFANELRRIGRAWYPGITSL